MVAIQICAYFTRSEIRSASHAKKNYSDPVYIGLIFPYTYFSDFSIPVGGNADVKKMACDI